MRASPLLSPFDRDLRMHWIVPEADRETVRSPDGRTLLVRYVRRPPAMSTILFTDLGSLEPAPLDQLIAREASAARDRGLRLTWKLYAHDEPADLGSRLMAHGFVPEEDPDDLGPVMILNVAAAPPALLAAPPADVRIVGREALDDLVEVEARVWGGDFGWLRERLADHLEVPGLLSMHVAYVDGRPACAGWSYYHPANRFAMLRGGATLPEHRRRGLYAAVLGARVREAKRRGLAYLVVEPSPMNVPIVRGYGFAELTRARDFVLDPRENEGP